MKCPKCRREQYFVCTNPKCVCHDRVPKGKLPQIWVDHEALKCPYCGRVEHIDYWEERDMAEATRKRP
jgi:aspartate carbamoyltransferase regulatory subunit